MQPKEQMLFWTETSHESGGPAVDALKPPAYAERDRSEYAVSLMTVLRQLLALEQRQSNLGGP